MLKEMRMSEEDLNQNYSTEETETSGSGNEQQNNTSNGSETETTQKNGAPKMVPYNRFKEVNDKLKQYESIATDKNSSVSQDVPEDKLWKAKIETKLSVPEHLKPQSDEIASYHARYNVPIEDAIAIFDSKNKVSTADVAAASAAQTEASQSRTGGTANHASRQDESEDPSKVSTEDLRSQLESELASGARI